METLSDKTLLIMSLVALTISLIYHIYSSKREEYWKNCHAALLGTFKGLKKDYALLEARYQKSLQPQIVSDPVTLRNGFVVSKMECDYVVHFLSAHDRDWENLATHCYHTVPLDLSSNRDLSKSGAFEPGTLRSYTVGGTTFTEGILKNSWRNIICCAFYFEGRDVKLRSPLADELMPSSS